MTLPHTSPWRRTLLLMATAAAMAAVSGCADSSTTAGSDSPSPAAASRSARTPSGAATAAGATSSGAQGATGTSAAPVPGAGTATPGTPPASPGASAAEAFATKVFAAWSSRTLSYDAWWAQLSPMLSSGGKAMFQYTDPANIPALKVTGPAKVTDAVKGPNAVAPGGANVAVPTSRGQFVVQLEHDQAGWAMYAMQFPKGVQ